MKEMFPYNTRVLLDATRIPEWFHAAGHWTEGPQLVAIWPANVLQYANTTLHNTTTCTDSWRETTRLLFGKYNNKHADELWLSCLFKHQKTVQSFSYRWALFLPIIQPCKRKYLTPLIILLCFWIHTMCWTVAHTHTQTHTQAHTQTIRDNGHHTTLQSCDVIRLVNWKRAFWPPAAVRVWVCGHRCRNCLLIVLVSRHPECDGTSCSRSGAAPQTAQPALASGGRGDQLAGLLSLDWQFNSCSIHIKEPLEHHCENGSPFNHFLTTCVRTEIRNNPVRREKYCTSKKICLKQRRGETCFDSFIGRAA